MPYDAESEPGFGKSLGRIFRLRVWAVWFLNRLADSSARSAQIAEPLLADEERVLGADHPDTLATRHNLANAYRAAGRTVEAITLLEQALADREQLLGIDHPDTLATPSNLAIAYREAGRTDGGKRSEPIVS